MGCDRDFAGMFDWTAEISIHAPTWGATVDLQKLGVSVDISIHAPTWGATSRDCDSCGSVFHFNPRTHVGCDVGYRLQVLTRKRFQSTHPRGVRRIGKNTFTVTELFQSTHPRGVRLGSTLTIVWIHRIFQSTHPRGVRLLSHQMVGF